MDVKPTPYRAPQQKRSRESLSRLIEAAVQELSAEGLEGFTVAGVVRRAGLSVGAFYARFPDKTALLHAAQDHFHNRLEPVIHSEMRACGAQADTLAEAVECTIEVLVRHVTGERELSRAFMMNSVFDPVLRARGERVNRERREVFSSVLLTHRAEIGHPDPVLAIDLAYGMYAAVIRGALVFGPQHELRNGVPSQTVVEELKLALTLYLRGEGKD